MKHSQPGQKFHNRHWEIAGRRYKGVKSEFTSPLYVFFLFSFLQFFFGCIYAISSAGFSKPPLKTLLVLQRKLVFLAIFVRGGVLTANPFRYELNSYIIYDLFIFIVHAR